MKASEGLAPSKSKVLPVNTKPLSWSDITNKLIKLVSRQKPQPLDLTGPEDEGFVFRTAKDRTLRRWRFADLPSHWVRWARTTLSHLDYITAWNITVWLFTCKERKRAENLIKYTNITRDYGTFAETTKECSSWLKSMGQHGSYAWRWCVEMNNLTGYRTLPSPGVDLKALADEFTLDVNTTNEPALYEVIKGLPYKKVPVRRELPNFETFISTPQLWATDGRSHLGKLNFKVGDEIVKIRLTKRLAPLVTTPESILESFKTWDGKERNVFLVKEEPGKIRLAVGGDDHTYLVMAWIAHCCSTFYDIAGITLAEDPVDEMARILDWAVRFNQPGTYSLPYDFKNFERQVSFRSIRTIWETMCSVARRRIQLSTQEEELVNKVSSGIDKIELIDQVSEPNKPRVLYPKGGLNSGLLITSIVGNVWNLSQGVRVSVLTSIPPPQVRGDDSVWIGTYAQMLKAYFTLTALGLKSSPGKFSIQHCETEFLRVWVTGREAFGYPSRAIVSLLERKPWSDGTWEPRAIYNDIRTSIDTIIRRGGNPTVLYKLRESWARNDARSKNMPMDLYGIPQSRGGFGLLQDNGLRAVWSSVFKPVIDSVWDAPIPQAWLEPYLRRGASEEQASILAKRRLDAIAVSCPDPQVRSAIRKQFNEWLSTVDVTTQPTHVNQTHLYAVSPYRNAASHVIPVLKDIRKQMHVLPGYKDPDFQAALELKYQFKIPLNNEMYLTYHRLRSFGLSRHEIVSWSGGSLPFYPFDTTLHPKLQTYLGVDIVARLFSFSRSRPTGASSLASQVTAMMADAAKSPYWQTLARFYQV